MGYTCVYATVKRLLTIVNEGLAVSLESLTFDSQEVIHGHPIKAHYASLYFPHSLQF